MKRTVTLFTLLLLAFSVQIAAAQQCPTIEGLTAKAADQQLLPAHMLEGKAAPYHVMHTSDLNDQERFTCLVTEGRSMVLPILTADDPLASILSEDWVQENWLNAFLAEFFYNGEVQVQSTISAWDAASSSWLLEGRVTFVSSDPNGFFTEVLTETWNGTGWDPEGRTLADWDSDGNQTRFEGQEWEDGAWNTFFLIETVFSDQTVVSITQGEDDDTGMLTNVSRSTITLDDQGRESELLQEIWNEDTAAWEVFTRRTKTYQDNTITELGQFPDGMGGWLNFDQTVFTLNDAGLPVEELSSSLFLGTADPSNRILSTYNDMNLLIEELDQSPDGAGGWITDFTYVATYDADGDVLEELYQENDGTALVNDERDTYNYGQTATSVEDDLGSTLASFDIYPSPARGRVQVEVTLAQPAALSVDVFDVLGRRVHQMADEQAAAGTQSFAWEPGDMPAGMYFVRITMDERAETRPLMLMK